MEVRFRCDFYHYSPESVAFDLGLERAEMTCVGQVEIEPFCQKVLAKHWPNVWRWNDVKTLTGELVKTHCGTIDLLCGGVPCQPASVAGKREGADDHRWLWPDFLRVVSEVNPVWVLAENPRGVLTLDVGGVQFSEWIADEFAVRGYELLPFKLAAEDVGAPHRRERVFFVAYHTGARLSKPRPAGKRQFPAQDGARVHDRFELNGSFLADANDRPSRWPSESTRSEAITQGWQSKNGGQRFSNGSASQWPARPGQPQHEWEQPRTVELPLGGAVAGLPVRLVRRHRVSALKSLGNAIVPQVAEVIGRAIIQMEATNGNFA